MVLTLCIDKQPKNNPSSELKTCQIDIGDRLCSKDGVYDELIIKLNEVNQLDGIIKRRCSIDRLDVITILPEEHIQTLEIPEITLFEGTNYVYLQEFDYLNMKIEYLTNVEMNKHFAKTEEFNSALVLTAQEFNLRLSQKLDGDEFTHASIVAKINDDTSEVQIEADKISLAGKEIDLTSDDIVIESTNFKVNKNGRVTATSGEIGGFNMDSTKFYNNIAGIYDYTKYDLATVKSFILDYIGKDMDTNSPYDYSGDGNINSLDSLKISKILQGIDENTKVINGKVEINSDNPKNCFSVVDNNNNIIVSLGLGGINTSLLNAHNIICGDYNALNSDVFHGVALNGENGKVTCRGTSSTDMIEMTPGDRFRMYSSNGNTITLRSNDGLIMCNSVQQSSLESKKKNFEKLENGLGIIKNIDIYKYNMKTDEDNDKKHIGFVIGDKYNYSKEITSKENDGVDIYSFVSVCCKAIQEQQEQIAQLQERIERLESGKKWHITELIGKIVRVLTRQ